MSPISLGFLVVVFAVASACQKPAPAPSNQVLSKSIDAAESAYFRFELANAERLYGEVFSDSQAPMDDRVKAGRALMNIAWHIHQQVDTAQEVVVRLEKLNFELSHSLSDFSQIQRKSGAYAAAMATAERALLSAESLPEKNVANLAYAQAALDQAKQQLFTDPKPQIDLQQVAQALERANRVLETQQGLAVPSLVALEAALILDHGQDAMNGWRSFFHIRDSNSITSVLIPPQATLTKLLAEQTIGGAAHDYRQLVFALQASRQFDAAAIVALMHLSADDRQDGAVAQLLAYREYLDELTAISYKYYRQAATGSADDDAFEAALEAAAKSVSKQFDVAAGPIATYSREWFLEEISRRFGAEVSFKRLSGYYGFHFGHRVADEDFQIEQYTETAELRFVSLDTMVSNGFTSWFWNGRAQVGGWADNPTIIQVRSAYSDGGIRAWKNVSDEKTQNRIEREMAERRLSDIEIARQNPYGYLPGLAQRLRQTSYERLLQDLKKKGLTDSALQLAFIAEVERISLEASIIAHEGRHAIEAGKVSNLIRSGSQKEFLAKLSEVAFSSAPKLAICGGILSSNIGNDSSHGVANQKIMKGLVQWMDDNLTQIAGFEPGQPLLPQLDLLTDEQLRSAIRSMDYLAGS